ncbi:Sfi1 domain-containing protein [Balamuthia mandrillaris]
MPRQKTSTAGKFSTRTRAALSSSVGLGKRLFRKRTINRKGKAEGVAIAAKDSHVTQRTDKRIYSGSDGSFGDVSNSEEEEEDLLGEKKGDYHDDEEEEPEDSHEFKKDDEEDDDIDEEDDDIDEEDDGEDDQSNEKDDEEEAYIDEEDDEEEQENCQSEEKGLGDGSEAYEFQLSKAGSSTQQKYVTHEMFSQALGDIDLMFSMKMASFERKLDGMLQDIRQRLT